MPLILLWCLSHQSLQFIALAMHICSLWNYLHDLFSLDYPGDLLPAYTKPVHGG